MTNLDFINLLGKIDRRIRKLVIKINNWFSEKKIKVDLSFDIADRNNYPNGIIGLNWEIDLNPDDIDGEYFTLELSNDFDNWSLDGYLSKHKDLELIESLIEFEVKTIEELSSNIEELLNDFEKNCLKCLRTRYK